MPPCRRCWRTWAGEPLRPGCSPQLELDKPSQINYTMNRKSADRNMASSTFPFKSKRLTAEFVRLGAVNLFCFYRSSREKFSSQHQMPLSQLRRAGSKEQLLPSVPAQTSVRVIRHPSLRRQAAPGKDPIQKSSVPIRLASFRKIGIREREVDHLHCRQRFSPAVSSISYSIA